MRTWRPLPGQLAALLCSLSAEIAIAAPTEAQSQIVVTTGIGKSGPVWEGRIDAAWIRAFGAATLVIGARRSDLDLARWTTVNVGGARVWRRGLAVSGSFESGPVDLGIERSALRRVTAQLSVPHGPRWTTEVGELQVDVGQLASRLATIGARRTTSRATSYAFGLIRDHGGDIRQSQLMLRFDNFGTTPRFSGGLSTGRTNDRQAAGIPEPTAAERRIVDGFLAVTSPAGAADLTIALELARIGGVRRAAISFSVRFPLHGRA